jgi:cytochrome c-type biogenesis protein CcmF
MTALLGSFCLALAFCSALLGVGAWAHAAVTGRPSGTGRWSAAACLAATAGSVGTLEYALLTHDFSVGFVAENGSRATPVYYTVTSLWAAHDGSLLLWVLILSGYLAVVAFRRTGDTALHGWAVSVLSAVAVFFLGLALFTGDVFDTVSPVPADGPGPTPLLQDHPAMGVHPPLLYAGLVGMAVPFAFAVAGLVTGQVGRGWLEAVRGYTRFAWTALTAGIVMGAWWSYAVLGWGGYWAWDPVENSSLMPWLVATALIHSSMVQRRRRALPVWNLSLAVSAFLLACLGTFLTRSGVITSVHSFADSGVGPILLGFLVALAAGVLVLVLLRSDRLGAPRPAGAPLSRGTALLLNNVLLVALAVTVLVGTLAPVLVESATGTRLSVGPPYYNRVAVPLCLLLLVMMAVGPVLSWRGDRVERLVRRLAVPVVLAAATLVVTWLLDSRSLAASVTFALAALVVTSMLVETGSEVVHARRERGAWAWVRRNRRRLSGRVVHLGLVVVAVGVAASSAYTTATEATLEQGGRTTFSGVHATLVSVGRDRDPREMRTSARLRLERGGDLAVVTPSLGFFPSHDTTVASPAVVSSVRGDVYVTLLSVDQSGRRATLRLAVNPMVGWIWAGGALMVLGSALGVRRRRRRDAAPAAPEVEREERRELAGVSAS